MCRYTCTSHHTALLIALILMTCLKRHTQTDAVNLTAAISGASPYAYNALWSLVDNKTTTEAIASAQDKHGNVFIAGHIYLPEGNAPAVITDVKADDLGQMDILVIKLSINGTVAWVRRTGSSRDDTVTGIDTDPEGNAYICGNVKGLVGDNGSGAYVMKFDNEGTRLWVQTYGSASGRESLNSIAITRDGKTILVTGEVGRLSQLLTEGWNGGPGISVLIARLGVFDGAVINTAVAEGLGDSYGASGNSITTTLRNGSETAFICGTASVDLNNHRNGAIFSFRLPGLQQEGGRYIVSSYKEEYTAITSSNNGHSVYCVGTAFLSIYAESDVRVTRFNASGLGTGWSVLLGSIKFGTFASIRSGLASEFGRSVVVDAYGNLYVLAQTTSPLRLAYSFNEEAGIDDLTNQRPGVLIFAPNGSVVDVGQSRQIASVTSMSLTKWDDIILVAGSTFYNRLTSTRALVSGFRIDAATMKSHTAEFTPPNSEHNTGGGDNGSGDDDSSDFAIWVIVGSVAGGLMLLIAIAILLFMICKLAPSH